MVRAMPPRGQVRLTITFGPAATPVFDAAVAYAREHAQNLDRAGPRTYRASFSLGTDPEGYGRALDLVHMVYGWRATHLEVAGSPERVQVIRAMLYCAREWLRRAGRCSERFYRGPYPKCRGCPLYDTEWAPESYSRPTLIWTVGEESPEGQVPDHVPEDWGLG